MKKFLTVVLTTFLLTSCNGWFFRPSPYNPPTPFLPPTNTPPIVSPTPVVVGVSSATPMVATPIPPPTNTPFTVITDTPTVVVPNTPAVVATNTASIPNPSINVEVLGCNTSIDVTHSMGEVTNAYVVVRNTGGVELTNLNTTLRALDEGREHPDKTVEVTSLFPGYKVTLKLTVDSTYQEDTPIQVEVTADGGLFHRVGAEACKDIGLFAPNPEDLTTPVPDNP
jgi:hypothetical protein